MNTKTIDPKANHAAWKEREAWKEGRLAEMRQCLRDAEQRAAAGDYVGAMQATIKATNKLAIVVNAERRVTKL